MANVIPHNGLKRPNVYSALYSGKVQRHLLIARAAIISVFVACAMVVWGSLDEQMKKRLPVVEDTKAEPLIVLPHIQRLWASFTPWYAAEDYPVPPHNCFITQVNMLQRHGARHPDASHAGPYRKSVQKLRDVKDHISNESGLSFLKNYTYELREDELLPFGAKQSFQLGTHDYKRYAYLVSKETPPFVRSSGKQRVIDSASNWTRGFTEESEHTVETSVSVVIPESQNNTLANEMCSKAGDGKKQTNTWLNQFAPRITKRLNKAAPGANLTDEDVYHIMSVCPFETLYHGSESPFCALFSLEEWAAFEYSGDLEKFYKTGYGEPLGPVQGVGYVNELLARLSNKPVKDETQTNTTLDRDPATFPLNRTFFADFSHENLIVAVYAAMGLYRDQDALDPLFSNPDRQWVASRLVPFSSRLVTEKMTCGGGGGEGGDAAADYIRVLVNDKLAVLDCAVDSNLGLCTLEEFVKSQAYARSNGGGDWQYCFEGDGEKVSLMNTDEIPTVGLLGFDT